MRYKNIGKKVEVFNLPLISLILFEGKAFLLEEEFSLCSLASLFFKRSEIFRIFYFLRVQSAV